MKSFVLVMTFLMAVSIKAEIVKVQVPGMVCQMCVYGMKKNFKDAVNDPDKDIIVDLDKKFVQVDLQVKMSDEEVKKRVTNAGYNAGKIERLSSKKEKVQ